MNEYDYAQQCAETRNAWRVTVRLIVGLLICVAIGLGAFYSIK